MNPAFRRTRQLLVCVAIPIDFYTHREYAERDDRLWSPLQTSGCSFPYASDADTSPRSFGVSRLAWMCWICGRVSWSIDSKFTSVVKSSFKRSMTTDGIVSTSFADKSLIESRLHWCTRWIVSSSWFRCKREFDTVFTVSICPWMFELSWWRAASNWSVRDREDGVCRLRSNDGFVSLGSSEEIGPSNEQNCSSVRINNVGWGVRSSRDMSASRSTANCSGVNRNSSN